MQKIVFNRFFIIVLALAIPAIFLAQQVPVPKINIGVDSAKTPEDVSLSLQIIALLTVLALAPTILILTTAFTRIVIILSFVRTAMGTSSIPPNQVVIGLSLFLTIYVMAPTYEKVNQSALQPYFNKEIKLDEALKRAEVPVKAFMTRSTYQKDLNLFLKLRKEKVKTPKDTSLLTLIPAFIVSELKTAFVVAFYIFVPFLMVDLVVASILMSMGMMMLPPTVVSLPAKILVFSLADGWSMLVSSLMAGYL